MDIRNPKNLRAFAAQRLEGHPHAPKIVLIFGLTAIGLAALTTLINYVIGLQISTLGGLGNMGIRSILSTTQTVLPLVQSMVLLCVDLGYISTMLRISRSQYASPNGLRLGFDRFWVLLRTTLITTFIYISVGFGAVYLAVSLFAMSPFSAKAMEILTPLISQTSILNNAIILDDATYAQLVSAMVPAFILCGILCLLFVGPIFYSYRMVNYILIDKPGIGALNALRMSKVIMRGKRLSLLKLDLHLWWYHAATAAAMALCYGDAIAPMLGITFPWNADVSYFLFFALYLAAQFAIYYFLRNPVEVTYALAYDAIKPEEKQNNGVVLGNIFQM